MKAMIFAAGLGTRLKPLTDTMPKALVSVGGRTLLEHVVTRLKAAGVREIVINVHHFADMIEDYVRQNDSFGIKVSFSDEREGLLETGGGVLKARKYLEGAPFVVHNVDILSDLDLAGLMKETDGRTLAVLAVSDRPTSRYLLFDEDMMLAGWMNVKTGEVKSPFGKIDPARYRAYAFSGIHCMAEVVFDAMDSLGFNGRFPVMDFYLKAAACYPVRGFLCKDLHLMDVGKLDTLDSAASFCMKYDIGH